MGRDIPSSWMWSEACEMLAGAERLHRQFFRPAGSVTRLPSWEPPVDILETEYAVLVLVAMPGANPDLVCAGDRGLPVYLRPAVIHRLDLPQGRFERRLRLPAGRYSAVRRSVVDGCLLITLQKTAQKAGRC